MLTKTGWPTLDIAFLFCVVRKKSGVLFFFNACSENKKHAMADQSAELLQCILDRLDALDDRLTRIEQSTAKMDGHVSFVESVYTTIQVPFHRLMGAVTFLGSPGPTLASRNNQTMQIAPSD